MYEEGEEEYKEEMKGDKKNTDDKWVKTKKSKHNPKIILSTKNSSSIY